MNTPEKINYNIKAWLGIGCSVLPIVRVAAVLFGWSPILDLISPIFDGVCTTSGLVGTTLLATSRSVTSNSKQ